MENLDPELHTGLGLDLLGAARQTARGSVLIVRSWSCGGAPFELVKVNPSINDSKRNEPY